MIKLGGSDVSFRLGASEVSKIYLGTQLVYESNVPDTYDAEIEYLEAPVGAYIDTGIVPTIDTGFSFDFKRPNRNHSYYVGARDSGATSLFLLAGTSNYYVGWSTAKYFNTGGIDRAEIKVNLYNSQTATINDADTINLPTFSTLPTRTILFFKANDPTNTAPQVQCVGYGGKITIGNTLVRDYIPVRKNGNGYFFDKVNQRLYGTAGNADFILGNDKT